MIDSFNTNDYHLDCVLSTGRDAFDGHGQTGSNIHGEEDWSGGMCPPYNTALCRADKFSLLQTEPLPEEPLMCRHCEEQRDEAIFESLIVLS